MDNHIDNESPPNENGGVNWPLRHMANEDNSETTITNKEATAAQLSPTECLERVSGADEACMLYAVHLFA